MTTQDINKIAKRVSAGASVITMPSPFLRYQDDVERNMKRYLRLTDIIGTYVPGSLEWESRYENSIVGEVAHRFTFKVLPKDGPDTEEYEGKIAVRFAGNDVSIRLLIYD